MEKLSWLEYLVFQRGFHNTHNAKILDNILKQVIKIKNNTEGVCKT